MASETGHPYSPPSAAIRGYVPNADPIAALAAQFVLLISVVVGSSLLVAVWNPYGQKLRRLDVFAVGWFALCWLYPLRPLSSATGTSNCLVFKLS